MITALRLRCPAAGVHVPGRRSCRARCRHVAGPEQASPGCAITTTRKNTAMLPADPVLRSHLLVPLLWPLPTYFPAPTLPVRKLGQLLGCWQPRRAHQGLQECSEPLPSSSGEGRGGEWLGPKGRRLRSGPNWSQTSFPTPLLRDPCAGHWAPPQSL